MGTCRELRAAGKTIVHVTHFMDEVVSADHVIALDDGRVAFEGTPEALFEQHELKLNACILKSRLPIRVAHALNNRGVVVCNSFGSARARRADGPSPRHGVARRRGGVAESCDAMATVVIGGMAAADRVRASSSFCARRDVLVPETRA